MIGSERTQCLTGLYTLTLSHADVGQIDIGRDVSSMTHRDNIGAALEVDSTDLTVEHTLGLGPRLSLQMPTIAL